MVELCLDSTLLRTHRLLHTLETFMIQQSSTESSHASDDAQLWDSLKSAIANSSGFQSWRSEQLSAITTKISDEQLVRLYLRDTLETLAY